MYELLERHGGSAADDVINISRHLFGKQHFVSDASLTLLLLRKKKSVDH